MQSMLHSEMMADSCIADSAHAVIGDSYINMVAELCVLPTATPTSTTRSLCLSPARADSGHTGPAREQTTRPLATPAAEGLGHSEGLTGAPDLEVPKQSGTLRCRRSKADSSSSTSSPHGLRAVRATQGTEAFASQLLDLDNSHSKRFESLKSFWVNQTLSTQPTRGGLQEPNPHSRLLRRLWLREATSAPETQQGALEDLGPRRAPNSEQEANSQDNTDEQDTSTPMSRRAMRGTAPVGLQDSDWKLCSGTS